MISWSGLQMTGDINLLPNYCFLVVLYKNYYCNELMTEQINQGVCRLFKIKILPKNLLRYAYYWKITESVWRRLYVWVVGLWEVQTMWKGWKESAERTGRLLISTTQNGLKYWSGGCCCALIRGGFSMRAHEHVNPRRYEIKNTISLLRKYAKIMYCI